MLRKVVAIVFITCVRSCLFNHLNEKFNANETKEAASRDQSLNYRLPNNSHPINYELWIKTDIHKGIFSFSGRVTVRIKLTETSETVTMHSRDIIIEKVDLYDNGGILSKSNLTFENSDEREFLIIHLRQSFTDGDEITLEITYHGNMTNEMTGLYYTFYKNERFQNIWMASTHFVPTNARRAFPCYDEPQIRAPIQLSMQHDKSYHALSNMPVSKVLPVGSSSALTVFKTTPPLQTYLLTFIVSNLNFIVVNKNSRIEQRIYGEPIKIENGTAEFAQKVTDDILEKFMEIFPVSLEILKMDHVQIPQLNGLLEHYGLNKYEESFLLLDNNFLDDVKEYFKPQIITVIAHGLTHQYFGGLVGPQWWQYLWLTEGFSVFFQYFIPSLLYPEYNYMEKFQNEVIEFAFEIDQGTEAMNDYVETPLEIQSKFNPIVFEKSAAVIRMFYEALSPSSFRKGLIMFLDEMRFKSATAKDLHRALQRAFDADYPDNNLNINSIMLSWESQSGYPVVSVKRNGNSIILTQARFTTHDNNNDFIYSIPITLTTKNTSNFSKTMAYSWMTTKILEINEIFSTPDEWIILNIQQVGFYRVDYSRELWDSIINGYKANYKIINHVNRKVLHDELYLAWKYLKTKVASDCLKLISVLEFETSGKIWESASQYMDLLNDFLRFSELHGYFQELMHKVLNPHIIKATKIASNDDKLSEEVKKWSRLSQHPFFLETELDKLVKIMFNIDIDEPDYCSAFRNANTTVYRHFLDKVIKFEVFIGFDLVAGLGCSLNRSLLNELFVDLLNPLNKVTEPIIENAIYSTTESSTVGLDAVMDLMSDKWWELNQLSPGFVEQLTLFMHNYINSQNQYEKFLILTKKLVLNRVLTAESTATWLQDIEMKLKDDEWNNIKEWFGVNDEQTSSTIPTSTEDTTLNAVTPSTSIRIITICISLGFLLTRIYA